MLTRSHLYRKYRIDFVVNSLIENHYNFFFFKNKIFDKEIFFLAVDYYYLSVLKPSFNFYNLNLGMFFSSFFKKAKSFFLNLNLNPFRYDNLNIMFTIKDRMFLYFQICFIFFKFKWILKSIIFFIIFVYLFYFKLVIKNGIDFFNFLPFLK